MRLIDTLKLQGAQYDAAMARGKDVSVSAGAGSGKTHTLVGRYLALVDEGLAPRSVVAITFTDKAAREMRNRVRRTVHDWLAGDCPDDQRERWLQVEADIDAARIQTIHGLCAAILRAHPAQAKIDPRFAVLEEGVAATLQAQVVEDTLAWSAGEPTLAPLYQAFETAQLQRALAALIRNRLQVPAPQTPAALLSCYQMGVAGGVRRFTTDPAVAGAVDELTGLAGDGTLVQDASVKLAEQVQRLLAQWQTVLAALDREEGMQAARALFEMRRQHCDGRTGKKTSRAKSAVAAVRERYDALVAPWMGGKSNDDTPPDAETEGRLAELMPLFGRLLDHALVDYAQAKDARQAVDFDDLEQGALELLGDRDIRSRWQRQIGALLVDEFQDTNERQRQIVQALAGTRDGLVGRLFVVGDAKQSIYRFRGADVAVFRRLADEIRLGGGESYVLDVTYRAHDALVSALNEILAPVMAPEQGARPFAVPFAPLSAHRSLAASGIVAPYVEILLGLGDTSDQAKVSAANLLARRLIEMHRQEQVPWDGIALLFRASTGFPEYEAALEAAGIPFVTVAGRGFYDRPEVRDILNMLRALADPWDDLAMVGLLRSPAFGLSDAALYRLRWPDGSTPSPIYDALAGDLTHLTEEDRQQAQRALRIVDHLAGLVDRVAVAELIKTILDETRYPAILASAPAGLRLERNLGKLLADAHASGLVRVAEFLEYVEALQSAGAREGEAPSDAGGAVRLMSVHRAKGLEFPIVVIADAGRARPPQSGPAIITPELGVLIKPVRLDMEPMAYRLAKMYERERDEAEDVRLLYVAATRAKEKLIVCGHQQQRTRQTWLNRLAEAAGIDLDLLVTKPGERQSIALPQSGQCIECLALAPELDTVPVEPGPVSQVEDVRGGTPLYDAIPRAETILADGKEEDARVKQRLRQRLGRVTARFRRADGTTVGLLVHAALAQWRFPGDPALAGAFRAAALEEGLLDSESLDVNSAQARQLLERLRADPRWTEIDTAPVRRHEVSYHILDEGRVSTGYVDLLYRDPQGCWQIVEFKTDALDDDKALTAKTAEYSAQVHRYRHAVEKLIGAAPSAWLCFLDYAGQVRWVSLA